MNNNDVPKGAACRSWCPMHLTVWMNAILSASVRSAEHCAANCSSSAVRRATPYDPRTTLLKHHFENGMEENEGGGKDEFHSRNRNWWWDGKIPSFEVQYKLIHLLLQWCWHWDKRGRLGHGEEKRKRKKIQKKKVSFQKFPPLPMQAPQPAMPQPQQQQSQQSQQSQPQASPSSTGGALSVSVSRPVFFVLEDSEDRHPIMIHPPARATQMIQQQNIQNIQQQPSPTVREFATLLHHVFRIPGLIKLNHWAQQNISSARLEKNTSQHTISRNIILSSSSYLFCDVNRTIGSFVQRCCG